MLSQGQFFDPSEYDIKPEQMDFGQWTRTADYWHGSRTHKRFNEQREGWVHAGTRGAAEARLRNTYSSGEHRLFPLHHVGEFGEPTEDRGRWSYKRLSQLDPETTHKYVNEVEARGTTSVIGPPSNFLSYRTMLRSLSPAQRSPVQEAERRAGHDYIPWERASMYRYGPVRQPALSYELAGGTKGPLPSAASTLQ